ncbi:hypothetical protein [Escherichia coli]|uniref:hypothetical protein n=1 Tax=Escherichia coli TaxID=562 RepID=UPI001FFF5AE9|nr:hypothetical protein [Escherichia coli]
MALTLLATNNAESTLASAISATDTSLIVSAGTGAEFPDAVAGESYFKLTLTDAATGSQVEIVNVTAKAGDIFTIERAQEGTLARAWAANDMVANMMTADTLNVIADFAKQASDSAEEAQGYALSASEFGDNKSTFADTAAGLAATTSGQYFRVPQGTGNVLSFRYYKNNSGVAQEVADYPGQGSITNTIREFPTLAAAQADADAGNILSGSTAFYRSTDDGVLSVEVINTSGTMKETGERTPSESGVKDKINKSYSDLNGKIGETNVLLGEVSTLPLTTFTSITAPGDTVVNVGKESVLLINSLSAAETSDARNQKNTLKVTDLQSGVTTIVAELLPAEYFADNVLNSPYHSVQLAKLRPATVLFDATNSVARAIFTNVPLINTYKSITAYAVIDKSGGFISGNTGAYGTDGNYCTLYTNSDSSTSIQLTFPYSVITGAGYDLTEEGIKNYFYNSFSDVNLYYRSTDVSVTKTAYIAKLSAEPATISVNDYLTIDADILYYNGVSRQDTNNNPFNRFVTDVANDSASNYSGPIELKISFPEGMVFGQNCIKVSDSAGNVFDAQFSADDFVNLRFQSNEGYHPDGSFKTGSVWIVDSVAAGQKKYYNIDVYGYRYDDTVYTDGLEYYAPSDALKRYNIKVGDLYYRFGFAGGAYGLTSIDAAENDDTNRIRCTLSPQHRYVNAGAQVIEYFTENVTLMVINSGPLFTEVERIGYNAASAVYAAGILKATTRYRIFKNGIVIVKNMVTALQEIPVGKMYGETIGSNIIYQTGTTPVYSGTAAAAITNGNTAGGGKFSYVPTIVNGDIHRDGTSAGPTRPTGITMTNTASNHTLGVTTGWQYSSFTDYSLLNWPVEKNWTWSIEIWLNANETETDPLTLAKKVYNRPVGFASGGALPNFAVKEAERKLQELLDGVADFWMNGDSAGIGGMDVNAGPYDVNTPWGYLAYRELQKPSPNIAAVWARFKRCWDDNWRTTNIGTRYLEGVVNVADLVTPVFKPCLSVYRAAEFMGDTTTTTAMQPYIKSWADAMVTAVAAKGGVPNTYTPSSVSAAVNINIYGMLLVALAIHAGMDTDGSYQSCYDTVMANLTNSSDVGRYLPSMLDSMPVSTSLARSRWYNYDMDLAPEYLMMTELLGGTPLFNNVNYGLQGLCGDGRLRGIDFIISESRRGIISTPVSVALTMMLVRRVSTGNALLACIQAYEKDYLTDPYSSGRFYDFSPRLASGIPTTISSHNKVMIEMMAGYFVHQIAKGRVIA